MCSTCVDNVDCIYSAHSETIRFPKKHNIAALIQSNIRKTLLQMDSAKSWILFNKVLIISCKDISVVCGPPHLHTSAQGDCVTASEGYFKTRIQTIMVRCECQTFCLCDASYFWSTALLDKLRTTIRNGTKSYNMNAMNTRHNVELFALLWNIEGFS